MDIRFVTRWTLDEHWQTPDIHKMHTGQTLNGHWIFPDAPGMDPSWTPDWTDNGLWTTAGQQMDTGQTSNGQLLDNVGTQDGHNTEWTPDRNWTDTGQTQD